MAQSVAPTHLALVVLASSLVFVVVAVSSRQRTRTSHCYIVIRYATLLDYINAKRKPTTLFTFHAQYMK